LPTKHAKQREDQLELSVLAFDVLSRVSWALLIRSIRACRAGALAKAGDSCAVSAFPQDFFDSLKQHAISIRI
jgi:hypothetical protein